MTKEELLAEAKRRYPIGTEVKSFVVSSNYIVKRSIYWSDYYITDGEVTLYSEKSKQWAEIVSLPEVKEELPEKWCVKINSITSKWFNENSQTGAKDYHTVTTGYLHYPHNNAIHHFSYVITGYTEITFDQFKRLVLKESLENKVSEAKEELFSIVKASIWSDNNYDKLPDFIKDSSSTNDEINLSSFNRSSKTIPIYIDSIESVNIEKLTPILLKKVNKTKI
jgi:hypothetical protein